MPDAPTVPESARGLSCLLLQVGDFLWIATINTTYIFEVTGISEEVGCESNRLCLMDDQGGGKALKVEIYGSRPDEGEGVPMFVVEGYGLEYYSPYHGGFVHTSAVRHLALNGEQIF